MLKTAIKKRGITKVLSCFLVFVILMSAVPVSVLASDSSDDVTGDVLNALSEPLCSISNLAHYPYSPKDVDTVNLYADVTSVSSIASVKAYWSTDEVNWNIIDMKVYSGTRYITKSRVPAQAAGTTVHYKIHATNSGGTAVSSTSSYTVQATTTGSLTGRVTDSSGKGINGATVTLGSWTTTTDNTAHYRFIDKTKGVYDFKVEKSGYNTYTGTATVGTGTTIKDVQLTINMPTNLVVTIQSPTKGFSVSKGTPTTVSAKITDNLENVITGASLVKATFTNGDDDLVLLDDGLHSDGAASNGVYANTWTPQTTAQGYTETACTIKVTAAHSSLGSAYDEVRGVIKSPELIMIELTPSSHDFGELQTTVSTAPFSFTLKNVGGGTATGEVSLTGSGKDQFIITSGKGSFSLDADQTKTIGVAFSQTSAGSKSATLYAKCSNCNDVQASLSGTCGEALLVSLSAKPNPTRDIDGATILTIVTCNGEPIEGAKVIITQVSSAGTFGFMNDDDPNTPPVKQISGITDEHGEFQAIWGYYTICLGVETLENFNVVASKSGYSSGSASTALTVKPYPEVPYLGRPTNAEQIIEYPCGNNKVWVTEKISSTTVNSGDVVFLEIQIGRTVNLENLDIFNVPVFKNVAGYSKNEKNAILLSLSNTKDIQGKVLTDGITVEALFWDWYPLGDIVNLNRVKNTISDLDTLKGIVRGNWIEFFAGQVPNVIMSVATMKYGQDLGHGPEGAVFDPENPNVKIFPLSFGSDTFGFGGFRIKIPVEFTGDGIAEINTHVSYSFVTKNQYALNTAGAQFDPITLVVSDAKEEPDLILTKEVLQIADQYKKNNEEYYVFYVNDKDPLSDGLDPVKHWYVIVYGVIDSNEFNNRKITGSIVIDADSNFKPLELDELPANDIFHAPAFAFYNSFNEGEIFQDDFCTYAEEQSKEFLRLHLQTISDLIWVEDAIENNEGGTVAQIVLTGVSTGLGLLLGGVPTYVQLTMGMVGCFSAWHDGNKIAELMNSKPFLYQIHGDFSDLARLYGDQQKFWLTASEGSYKRLKYIMPGQDNSLDELTLEECMYILNGFASIAEIGDDQETLNMARLEADGLLEKRMYRKDIIRPIIMGFYEDMVSNYRFASTKLCTSPDPPSTIFGTVPKDQTRTWDLFITNSGSGTLTWTISSDPPSWINVNPTSGSTTTEADVVTVTIDTHDLTLGTHTGHITLTSNGGEKTGTITVNVPPPALEPKLCTSPDPPTTNFGTVAKDQTRTWDFFITNCGSGMLTWAITCDQPSWLIVNPTSGSTTTEADVVTVTIDTHDLTPGPHTGHITLTSNGGDKTGTITVEVPSKPTTPDVGFKGIVFFPCTYKDFTGQGIEVTNILSDPNGKLANSKNICTYWTEDTLAQIDNVACGEEVEVYGTLIEDPDVAEVWMIVRLETSTHYIVRLKQGPPQLCTWPTTPSHDFGTVAKDQTRTWDFDVTNCGSGTLTWSVSDDKNWMSVYPTSGSTTTESDTVTVRIDTQGLSPGTHTGHISLTSNGGDKTGTITVVVPEPQNQPPENPTLTPDRSSPQLAGTTIKWTASATDPDGDTLYYQFRLKGPATGNSWQTKRDWSTARTWTWYTTASDVGETDVSVRIRDGHHASKSSYDLTKTVYEYTITAEKKRPTATIDSITPNPATQGKDTVRFKGHGYDSDGYIVEYYWKSSKDGKLSSSKEFRKSASNLDVGTHTISFKVKDNDGLWSNWATMTLKIKEKKEDSKYVKFRGVVTWKSALRMGGASWIVNVDEWISGSISCDEIEVIWGSGLSHGSFDPDISTGDRVEAYGKVNPWGGGKCTVGLNDESYYIKKV